MDVVVLAAGRGTRYARATARPQFSKPLAPVGANGLSDGVPAVWEIAAATAYVRSGTDRLIVVCAPANVLRIHRAVDVAGPVCLAVQREPWGPADALRVGMQLVRTHRVLVLMGDEVTTIEDTCRVAHQDAPALGVYAASHESALARRLTRHNWARNVWEEGDELTAEQVRLGHVLCWRGPLLLESSRVRRTLRRLDPTDPPPGTEYLLGPLLDQLLGPDYARVPVTTIDVDSPEAATWTRFAH